MDTSQLEVPTRTLMQIYGFTDYVQVHRAVHAGEIPQPVNHEAVGIGRQRWWRLGDLLAARGKLDK